MLVSRAERPARIVQLETVAYVCSTQELGHARDEGVAFALVDRAREGVAAALVGLGLELDAIRPHEDASRAVLTRLADLDAPSTAPEGARDAPHSAEERHDDLASYIVPVRQHGA